MKSDKLTVDYVKELLVRHHGNLYHAGREAGVSRSTLVRYVKRYPSLLAVKKEAEEQLIDIVESAFLQKALKGDTSCLIFFLKCRAKHRGYVEKADLAISGNLSIKVRWSNDED